MLHHKNGKSRCCVIRFPLFLSYSSISAAPSAHTLFIPPNPDASSLSFLCLFSNSFSTKIYRVLFPLYIWNSFCSLIARVALNKANFSLLYFDWQSSILEPRFRKRLFYFQRFEYATTEATNVRSSIETINDSCVAIHSKWKKRSRLDFCTWMWFPLFIGNRVRNGCISNQSASYGMKKVERHRIRIRKSRGEIPRKKVNSKGTRAAGDVMLEALCKSWDLVRRGIDATCCTTKPTSIIDYSQFTFDHWSWHCVALTRRCQKFLWWFFLLTVSNGLINNQINDNGARGSPFVSFLGQ